MTVETAAELFHAMPPVRHKMETLQRVGLGYITSASRRPRSRAARRNGSSSPRSSVRRATGDTLYILDEPTTGLHFEDVRKLLEVLHALVEQGNTVVVIEHNLEVIKTADHIVDLGPEGGDDGGRIVAAGTPEEVAATAASYTGALPRPASSPRRREKRSAERDRARRIHSRSMNSSIVSPACLMMARRVFGFKSRL